MKVKNTIEEFCDFIENNLMDIDHIIAQRPDLQFGEVEEFSRATNPPTLKLASNYVDLSKAKWITVEMKRESKKEVRNFYF